jgi:hypothetical protein
MNSAVKTGLALGAVALLGAGAMLALAAAALAPTTACTPSAGGTAAVLGSFDADQRANAVTIVRVGSQLQVPSRGWVIAVATAIQESDLRNLGNLGARNDHDSLGLFQQRPSQGWGSPAQLTDPVYAATAFYRALLRIPHWSTLPLTVVAQAVQRSAYPDAYAPHEPAAAALVNAAAAQLGLAVCTPSVPVPAVWSTPTRPVADSLRRRHVHARPEARCAARGRRRHPLAPRLDHRGRHRADRDGGADEQIGRHRPHMDWAHAHLPMHHSGWPARATPLLTAAEQLVISVNSSSRQSLIP